MSHPYISSHVVVHSGQTLTGIAAAHCHGTASDWTGIYHVNAKTIGNDPNLILPGQHLAVACYQAPVAYRHAVTYHTGDGKTWGVSYGDPNYCGDGDKDGWDVPCGHYSTAASLPVASSSWTGGSASASSAYSAFPGASCIVTKESGGSPTAYNSSSGAAGLFQDLPSTWNNYGGYASAKDAPVSVQIQFNQRLAATAGLSQWAADGCPGT